jgi:hypothetical protein
MLADGLGLSRTVQGLLGRLQRGAHGGGAGSLVVPDADET